MIKAESLSYSYGDIEALKNISFTIKENDFLAILGPNGAGKTTLIKLLLGILEPVTGSLQIKTKSIGYVPQKYSVEKLFPGTVREILSSIRSDFKLPKELELKKLLNKKFNELSGGQQQRVLITLSLQNNPKILILDEPTVGVDIKAQKEFFSYLKKLNTQKKIAIILVTHDVGMVPKIAKTVLCLNHNVCCMGSASQTNKLLSKVYGAHKEHHHKH